MEIAACLILRRLSFFAILFLSSIVMLHAQVLIKERLDIKPGVKTLNKSASSSSLPCFTGFFDSTSSSVQISVHRNCTVTATGTFERSEEGVAVSDVPGIISRYYEALLINETKTFMSPCGDEIACRMIGLGSCGGLYDIRAGGSVTENSAHFNITATWNCVAAHPVQILATIDLTASSLDYPVAVEMNATPDVLDEDTPSGDGIRRSVINARWTDINSNDFAACCANVTFRIENPISGVTLRWIDENNEVKYGEYAEVSYCGASSSIVLEWDGSGIFSDSCEIFIRAEGIGVTALQKILLKKRYPDHFVVKPESNTLSLCESTKITAIATNENEEEVAFDGSKLVDIISGVTEGNFIVGSDTIPEKIIVPYEQAKSGTIRYFVDVSSANLNGGQTSFLAYRDDSPPPFYEIWSGNIDIEPSCALLKLSNRTISPGETVKINVVASTLKGEFPYPEDQKFNIWLNTGDNWYGSLRCPGKPDTGAYLFNLPQPFEFVATDVIEADSVSVEMEIFVFPPGGPAGSVGIKDTLSSPASVMAKKGTAANSAIAVSNETNKSKLELSIKQLQSLLDKGISKKRNEIQTQKLAKKIEILKSQLAYETAKTPTEKQNAIANIKQLAMLDGEGAICQKTAKVTIEREDDFKEFKITLSCDTLKNRDVAIITCIAVDNDDNEIQLDPLTPLNLSFTSLTEYVDFISVTGEYSDMLSNVSYGALRNGLIKVIAQGTQISTAIASIRAKVTARMTKESSDGSGDQYPKTKIKVEMASDATKAGIRDLVLKPKIEVKVASNEIKPSFPGHIPVTESRTDVEIVVTVSGVPFSLPFSVEITSSVAESSGGHVHIGNRPTGRFIDEDGKPYVSLLKTVKGQLITHYQSSICGGEEHIFAKLILNPVIVDSDYVIVRVPGLINLTGNSSIWQLTGNVGKTYYNRCPGTEIHHPDSHYGTAGTIDRLQSAIEKFYEWSGSEDGVGQYLVLGINDMSLVNGGLFDICSTWSQGHGLHRIGTSVDISDSDPNHKIKNSDNTWTNIVGKKLKEIFNLYSALPEPEEPIHFEFY